MQKNFLRAICFLFISAMVFSSVECFGSKSDFWSVFPMMLATLAFVVGSYINNRGTSRRLEKLTEKRNKKIYDFIHKVSRCIVTYCKEKKIDTIIIGNNEGWKQNTNMGKENNQKFICLPHSLFIKKIEYKALEAGICVVTNEESYTSKASFLDNDSIPIFDPLQADKKYKFSGRRVKRGLYRSKNKTLVNADINAAANIVRKVFPNAFAEGIQAVGLRPLRMQILVKKLC